MKLGLITAGAEKAICEHTKEVRIGIDELTEAVIVEDPSTHVPNIESINTSLAVRNMRAQEKLQELFFKELDVQLATPVSYLYGFMSPSGLSDMLEVSYSIRFMAGEVGMPLGFVQGTAIPATSEMRAAFPQIGTIEQALKDIEYKGEIALGCNSNFTICDILFGHKTGMFALYTELSQLSPQANYEWCLGIGDYCKVHADGVSIATLISNPPFPGPTYTESKIIAPIAAERHLYRMNVLGHEVAFVATWGKDVIEAKRRTRRTIENCVSFNPNLQYRIDYGYKEVFVLNQERYKELGGQ